MGCEELQWIVDSELQGLVAPLVRGCLNCDLGRLRGWAVICVGVVGEAESGGLRGVFL